MQFQIKKRVFSLGDTYDITDDQGNSAYQAKGQVLSFGNQLDLLDTEGIPVAHISQRLFSFTSEYDITIGSQEAIIVKKQLFTLFQPIFDVEGPAGVFQMVGDWASWNYTIQTNGQTVAQIGKQFAVFQDTYGIEIAAGADVPTLLCLVIVMDEVIHSDHND